MITRRAALTLLSSTLVAPHLTARPAAQTVLLRPKLAGTLRLSARGRAAKPAGPGTESGTVQPYERTLEWNVSETAIIVCDMWNDHYCVSAARRVVEMVPRLNEVLAAARRFGVAVIHAPSSTMDFYKDTPQRRRAMAAPPLTPPVPIARWCYLDKNAEAPLPIDDTGEPCDDAVGRGHVRMYSRQHPDIVIGPQDAISSIGQEIYNYCEQLGIRNIVMTGVHANMCILGRPFGIRQQKRLGRNVVLVRDLTDAMYDPRDEPYVSHRRGTEMVIEHIEQFWCPSILSKDLLSIVPGSGRQRHSVSSGA